MSPITHHVGERMPDRTIDIPVIRDPNLHSIRVCGLVRTKSRAVINRIAAIGEDGVYAKIGTGRYPQYIELFGGGQKREHLHINIISPRGLWKPKKVVPLAKLSAALEGFIGETLETNLSARFLIRLGSLPKDGIIRSEVTEQKRGRVTVKQTGQRLRLKGVPITGLDWQLFPDGKAVQVELWTRSAAKIDKEYLTRFYLLMSTAFRYLVLQKVPHAPSNNK